VAATLRAFSLSVIAKDLQHTLERPASGLSSNMWEQAEEAGVIP